MADTTELDEAAGRMERQRPKIAGGVTDCAAQIGSELLAVAREGVAALADEQRHRAADEIAAIGDALHCSAESLAANSELPLDRYADDAAQYLCNLAQTVRERSWTQVADDVEGIARAEPMTFIAAMVGIGLLAGRFLLSTPLRPPQTGIGEMVPERPSEEARGDRNARSAALSADVPASGVAAVEGA